VLRILEESEMVIKTKAHDRVLWLPVRSQTARARAMLASPSRADDVIITNVTRI